MSIIFLNNFWMVKGISPTQKLVLISLGDQANDDGICWPSVATIQKRTCLSERAVRNAIKKLEELGYLHRSHRLNQPTFYTLYLQAVDPPAPYAPQQLVSKVPAPDADTPALDSNITTNNQKEPPKKNTLSAKDLVELGVDEQIAKDFLTIRKTKRLPLTQTALDGIAREAEKAGIELATAIKLSTESGWAGFKAAWVKNQQQGNFNGDSSIDLGDTTWAATE